MGMPCIVYGQSSLMTLMPGMAEPANASSAPCFEPTPRPMSPKMRKLVLKFRRQNGRCYYQKYRTHTCNRKPRRRCVFSKPTPPGERTSCVRFSLRSRRAQPTRDRCQSSPKPKETPQEPSMPSSSSRDFAEGLLLLQLESLQICIVGVAGPY